MSHMQRFCHVGAAVVDNDLLGMFGLLQTEFFICLHALLIGEQKCLTDLQVQESGGYCHHFGKYLAVF